MDNAKEFVHSGDTELRLEADASIVHAVDTDAKLSVQVRLAQGMCWKELGKHKAEARAVGYNKSSWKRALGEQSEQHKNMVSNRSPLPECRAPDPLEDSWRLRAAVAEAQVEAMQSFAAEREQHRTERVSLQKTLSQTVEALDKVMLAMAATADNATKSQVRLPVPEPHAPKPSVCAPLPHAQPRVQPADQKQRYDIVISYQTGQLEFMLKVRDSLRERGFTTTDGTEVPAGGDWRRFFFPALCRATVFVPILSDSFLFSLACEDEVTFAWDKRKPFFPILFELDSLQQVVDDPASYTDRRPDIEDYIPKFESIFNRSNRIPSKGRFEDDFAANIDRLASAISEKVQCHKDNMDDEELDEDVASLAKDTQLLSLRRSSSRQPDSVGEHELRELTPSVVREYVLSVGTATGHRKATLLGNLVTMLRMPPEGRLVFVASGVMAVIVDALEAVCSDKKHGPAIAEYAAACARNLLGRPEFVETSGFAKQQSDWDRNSLLFVECGGISSLVRHIEESPRTVRRGWFNCQDPDSDLHQARVHCMHALEGICRVRDGSGNHPYAEGLLVEGRLVPLLLELCELDDSEIRINAVAILGALTMGTNKPFVDLRWAMLKVHLSQIVTRVSDTPGEDSEKVLWLAANVVKSVGLEVLHLTCLMRMAATSLQDAEHVASMAAYFFSRIARKSTDDVVRVMQQAGAIAALVQTLADGIKQQRRKTTKLDNKDPTAEAQRLATSTLALLCKNSKGKDRVCALLAETDHDSIVPLLLWQSDPYALQSYGTDTNRTKPPKPTNLLRAESAKLLLHLLPASVIVPQEITQQGEAAAMAALDFAISKQTRY